MAPPYLASYLPIAPMRGSHVDAFFSLGTDPTAEETAAWKRESVHAVVADDCKLKIAVKWRAGNKLPIHIISSSGDRHLKNYRAVHSYQIDLGQSGEKAGPGADAVGGESEGATQILFLIVAPREGKA